MIDSEQSAKIKAEIISQIKSWQASEEQKTKAISQVESMNEKQLEEFLEKNNAMQKQECPFCLIVKNKIPAYKIDENKQALAVLEINPASKGHSLIIPLEHSEKIPAQANTLAKKISKKLKSKFNPKEVSISPSTFQGHAILNVLPDYGEKQERKKAEKEELEKLQLELKTEKKQKNPPIQEKQIEEKEEPLPKAPKRIP